MRPPAPVPAPPPFMAKLTPEDIVARKKAKEAAKKAAAKSAGKDDKKGDMKKKAKKPVAFVPLTTFDAPAYNLANIKLDKPKKKKAAAAK
jgi:hypothetical protein